MQVLGEGAAQTIGATQLLLHRPTTTKQGIKTKEARNKICPEGNSLIKDKRRRKCQGIQKSSKNIQKMI